MLSPPCGGLTFWGLRGPGRRQQLQNRVHADHQSVIGASVLVASWRSRCLREATRANPKAASLPSTTDSQPTHSPNPPDGIAADHPVCAISPTSTSARERHFLSGSDGYRSGGSGPVAVPRLGSQRREWLPEWLPSVRRSICGHAAKPFRYRPCWHARRNSNPQPSDP